MNNPKIPARTHYRIEMLVDLSPNKWQRISFIIFEASHAHAKNRALQLAADQGYTNLRIV